MGILWVFMGLIWCLFLGLGYLLWVGPSLVYKKLKRNGFGGPSPSFPYGNYGDIRKKKSNSISSSTKTISHDIHSIAFSYFSRWQKSFGKVFVYWLGTEPFVYIADPEYLKRMSGGVMGRNWGKPNVFKGDRKPIFGIKGLLTVEGDEWVRHRHVITPAFNPLNLKDMISSMVESTTKMLYRWTNEVKNGNTEIDVENEIIEITGEIIAKASFGMSDKIGSEVFEKLRVVQFAIFDPNRYVGVPFNKFMAPKKILEARKLGKEIDELLLMIINDRRNSNEDVGRSSRKDLLGILLEKDGTKNSLSNRELVDECKTFFFGGHETTALSLTWTLLLLAMNPKWQSELRNEIKEVFGDGNDIDFFNFVALKKMGWVMSEALRLYPPAPNTQRQVRGDIKIDDHQVIPDGTNVWIDSVSMHHDPDLWGEDVNEFKPERFEDDIHGGCKHKMGYMPFGFGGRMCIGRNLSMMEYKVVLTLILKKFSFSVSSNYVHSPSHLLSLRPSSGLPLIVEPL